MRKINCWEYFGCEREPGGRREYELGPCPAAVEARLEGVNSGHKGGRSCWGVPGTLCGDVRNEDHETKVARCIDCSFRVKVILEESYRYMGARQIFDRLKSPLPGVNHLISD